jgi:hypothetical protein
VFDDPFVKSKVEPSEMEVVIGRIIWGHAGRVNPISIAEIKRQISDPKLSVRTVKNVVEQLRVMHRLPIGASREEPFGYFRIVDAEDRAVAVRPYRKQILTMWRTLRTLDSAERCRELLGQLTLE